MRSTDLFLALLNHKKRNFDELKWPGEGTFEVILGAILVQNTNWKNVEKALDNLKKASKDSLQGICTLENSELATLIKPSGFYNTKAKRLKTLCLAIKNEFGDFENFKEKKSLVFPTLKKLTLMTPDLLQTPGLLIGRTLHIGLHKHLPAEFPRNEGPCKSLCIEPLDDLACKHLFQQTSHYLQPLPYS